MLLYHQIGRDYLPEVVSNPLCSSSQLTVLNDDEFGEPNRRGLWIISESCVKPWSSLMIKVWFYL